jgi:alpha-glucosidase
LRQVVDEFEDRVLIGETDDIAFYGNGSDELHLAFNFPLMKTSRLSAEWVWQNQAARLSALPAGAWPCNTLNNHDTGRVYSNLGDGKHDEELAKLSLAVVLLLKGTPFLFNGEEIGMRNYYRFQLEEFRDPESIRTYNAEKNLMNLPEAEALDYASRNGRDKGRTPMQWDASANAGFSPFGTQTWLPVGPDYQSGVNVSDQMKDLSSLWYFYRDLLNLRKMNPALIEGDFKPLKIDSNIFGFIRQSESQAVLVLINFENQRIITNSPELVGNGKKFFSSSSKGTEQQTCKRIKLQPFEIWLGELIP